MQLHTERTTIKFPGLLIELTEMQCDLNILIWVLPPTYFFRQKIVSFFILTSTSDWLGVYFRKALFTMVRDSARLILYHWHILVGDIEYLLRMPSIASSG